MSLLSYCDANVANEALLSNSRKKIANVEHYNLQVLEIIEIYKTGHLNKRHHQTTSS